MYLVEYTDTFGGEANYCWVRRGEVDMQGASPREMGRSKYLRKLLRAARASVGLEGVKGDIVMEADDEYHWKPRGMCTILMVRWDY